MITTNVTTLLSTIRVQSGCHYILYCGDRIYDFFYSEQLILHLNIAIIVTLFRNNSIVCYQ